jgi:hypothetical protein
MVLLWKLLGWTAFAAAATLLTPLAVGLAPEVKIILRFRFKFNR